MVAENASRLAKAWSLSKSEIRWMESDQLRIRHPCVPKKLPLPPLTHVRWFRDLTDEGIEPNPGPSSNCACKPSPSRVWLKDLCQDGDVHPHPGPNGFLTCRSLNIASWHSHGRPVVPEVLRRQVPMVLVQETNLSVQALPSATLAALRWGWHMAAVAKLLRMRPAVPILVGLQLSFKALGRLAGAEALHNPRSAGYVRSRCSGRAEAQCACWLLEAGHSG